MVMTRSVRCLVLLNLLLVLASCSGPPGPEKTTVHFLEAFDSLETGYRAVATAPLRIEFSTPDGNFLYRDFLGYLNERLSDDGYSEGERSELIAVRARRAALTLPFVEKSTPAFSEPSEVAPLFAAIDASFQNCEAIELEGELRYQDLSSDRRGPNREGSTRYHTRSEFRHRGWTLFEFHPHIQPSDTRPYRYVSTGKRSYLDGTLVDATEKSGTDTDPGRLPYRREAVIRETVPGFTNLNWENGLSPFLAYYEILGSYGGSEFFSAENRERHEALNVAIESRGELVAITLASGVVGEGFARTVLVLDPSSSYALVSARTVMAVEEDLTPSIENLVEAREFRFVEENGNRLHYPSRHRFELRAREDFEVRGEHEIKSMRLPTELERADFEITFDDSWAIVDRRKEAAER